MKQAALGRAFPEPQFLDDEQAPVLERGSPISSQGYTESSWGGGRGKRGSAWHPPAAAHTHTCRAPGPAGDALTGAPGFCTRGSTAGDGGHSLYLTKAPSRAKTSCTPSMIKGPICPFSLTVLKLTGSSHRSQRVLSAASMSRASSCVLDHTSAQASPSTREAHSPFPGFQCKLRLVYSD